MAEWTDSGSLFQRDRVKSPCTCVGLYRKDQQTNTFVWSQCMGWESFSKHGVKINRLFFMKGFVGQQTDLEKYLKYTGNQWKEWSSGTLRLKGGDFVTTRASWFWIHWILARPESVLPYKSELQESRRLYTTAVASNVALSRSRWRRICRRSHIW